MPETPPACLPLRCCRHQPCCVICGSSTRPTAAAMKPCRYLTCDRQFVSVPARNVHEGKAHGSVWTRNPVAAVRREVKREVVRLRTVAEETQRDFINARDQRIAAEERVRTLEALLSEAFPHIGDEYQRSWPDDEGFDDMIRRIRVALGWDAKAAPPTDDAGTQEEAP